MNASEYDFDLTPDISLMLRVEQRDGHTHCTVFAGRTRGSRGNAGRLILRDEEFDALVALLELGTEARRIRERYGPASLLDSDA